MNRLSKRVKEGREGGGGKRSKKRKKGRVEEGVRPVDKGLKACRNRRRNLNLY